MSKYAHILGRRPALLLTILLTGLVIAVLLSQGALAATWQQQITAATGDVGQYSSIALDTSGKPSIAYYDASKATLEFAYKGTDDVWHPAPVDQSETVGQYASLAIDTSDVPQISYYDAANGDLKYAFKDSDGTWYREFVDSPGDVGLYTSLAVDSSRNPHISYYDASNAKLKYASKDGSGNWDAETVDDTDSVGQYSSIAVDSSDVSPVVHISYYDTTNQDLKYAYKDGNGWHTQTVDNTFDIGTYTSLALDFAGQPHVSYYDATNKDLKYAYRNAAGYWQIETVDGTTSAVAVGMYSSITCDMSGMPHISYYDETNGQLKYAYKDANGWHRELVDKDNGKNVGQYTSIARDNLNDLHISYYDVYNQDLKYSYKENTPPTIGGTTPCANATDTIVSSTITISFSEPVQASTYFKNIALKDSAGTTLTVEVSIKKNVVTIKSSSILKYNSTYTVSIPGKAVTDLSHNEFTESYSFTFKTVTPADQTPPVTSMNVSGTKANPGNEWYISAAPTVRLTTNEAATVYYKWDNEDITHTVQNTVQITAPEGVHTLSYHAIDSFDNIEIAHSETVKVDTIVPKTTVNVDPVTADGPDSWYKTIPNITLSATEPATFYYRWDNREETIFTGSITPLEGNHTLYYRAVDQAGNVEATRDNAARKTIKVDSNAPSTAIAVNPAYPNGTGGWYVDTPPTVTLTVDEPYSLPITLYYKWDNSEETCVAAKQLQMTAPEGVHTITYYAIDKVGNKENTHTRSLYVDALPPTTPSISCACTATATNFNHIEVSGTADASTTVYIRITNGSTESTTSVSCDGTFSATFNLTNFEDSRTISVTAYSVDEAGNTSTACSPRTITKDTVLPTTMLTINPVSVDGNEGWFKTIPSITLSRSEPGVTYYAWDSTTAWSVYSTPLSAREGVSTLYCRSVDMVGNNGGITSTAFKVDVTAPTVSITQPTSDATISGNSLSVVASSSDDTLSGLGIALLYMDGSIVATDTSSPYSFILDTTRYSNSGHTLKVRVYDNAGNFRDSQINVKVSNDGPFTAPTLVGTDTVVNPGFGVDIRYSAISHEGTTTVSMTSTAPALPSGFALAGNFYEITTTATFTGDIFVTLPYDPGISAAEEATLKLLHWQAGAWVDVTYSKDTVAKKITGRVSSLSPFAVVKQPVVVSTPSSGGGNSNPVSTPQDPAPATPQGLKLVSNKGTIQLAWDPNKEPDLAGYRVYRIMGHGGSDKPGKIAPLANVSVTQYNDTSAEASIVYTYYITAVDKAGNESGQARLVAALAEVEAEVTFFDVPSNAWYKGYVSKLASQKVLGGYPDGTFKPNKAVSRVEFAKMICLAMGWDLVNPAKPSFGDVSKQSWEYRYVETAKAHGAISGYPNGTFAPGKSITRAEIASILAKALKLPAGSSTLLIDINSSWSKGYINSCVKAGIISGYPNRTFKPNAPATRAEAAKMISALIK